MDNTSVSASPVLVDLFRHNIWANVRLFEACESLSDEQLDITIPGTYGTIRDTLFHVVRAEVSYVERVTGQLPGEPHKPGEIPDFTTLKHDIRWTGEELMKLALSAEESSMVEGKMVKETDGRVQVQYPLSALLAQAINHATEHRSQIATILTQQGIEPPDMSGWAYMEETGLFQESTVEESADSK